VAVIIIMIIFLALMYAYFYPPEWFDEIAGWGDNIDPDMRMFPKESEFKMERVVTISISGSINEYTLKAAEPKQIPSDGYQQDVLEFTKDPGETISYPNVGKNEVLIWTENDVSGSRQVTLYYHIKSHSYEWEIDSGDSGTLADIPQEYIDRYRGESWAVVDDYGAPVDFDGDGVQDYRFNPNNPVIKAQAEEIVGSETNVFKIVEKIYEWVVENHDYPSTAQMATDNEKNWNLPKHPLVTMRDKRGDCDDQSFLFGSLCRAVGVPAWLVLGGLYDCMQESWCGHGWAEVYIPMSGGGFETPTVDCVNQEFLFRDCFRYTDWVDTGQNITIDGEDKNNLDYVYHLFSHRGGKLGTRGGANLQESYIDIDFDYSGVMNRPIDGPGGKYILPGLNVDPESTGYESWLIVGTFISGLILTLVVFSKRRR